MALASENLALGIVRKLQSAGHVAYFAGGCVRDRLMGRVPKDFDVATSARPEQVLGLFPRGQQVGAAFGVILVVERRAGERVQVEVATFRSDGTYSDGRHPDAVKFTTPEHDAQRRDFTCNGLFLDPLANGGAGEVHDFVGGRADIERKVLRAIGDPEARFGEDHLRMLRAVRFAAKLGFEIETGTRAAIRRHAAKIRTISRERIGEEFRMMLEHPARGGAVRMMEQLRLMQEIWPVQPPERSGEVRRMDVLPSDATRALGLAALCLDYGGGAEWVDALREAFALSNQERNDIAWLLGNLDSLLERGRWVRRITKKLLADSRWERLLALYVAARGGAQDAELDQWVKQMIAEGVAPVPFVTGGTLIQLGASPGPRFRGWIDALYDRQLENEFSNAEQAVAAARGLIVSDSARE
jgi:poly(A) polymerase